MKDILTKHTRLLSFSYLDGATLYHKIALLNKEMRASLPNAGLLDQLKVLKSINYFDESDIISRQVFFSKLKLKYALNIADNIQFNIDGFCKLKEKKFKYICTLI
jgi:hypothetical protein